MVEENKKYFTISNVLFIMMILLVVFGLYDMIFKDYFEGFVESFLPLIVLALQNIMEKKK